MALRDGAPSELNFLRDVGSDLVPYTGYDVETGSANDVLGVFYVPFKCHIFQFGFYITETFACDNTAPIFYFDEAAVGTIPTEDGDVGIMTIADGTAAGKMLYNKPVDKATPERITLEEGKWVVVSLQTAAVDAGTEAGRVIPYMLVNYVPEAPANNSSMTELEA